MTGQPAPMTIWEDPELPGFRFEATPCPAHGKARLGRLQTPHGVVETPAFIFCGTKANVKAVPMSSVKSTGTQIILSNTYHLMLQPGSQIVADHGGLHKFSGWDGPFLTDSGGFQVFSLAHGGVADEIKSARKTERPKKDVLRITEEGVAFRSYIDGSRVMLTPESSIRVQRQLGADIILTFDECTPFHVDRNYTEASLARTQRWTERSIASYLQPADDYAPRHGSAGAQGLYGISQGGVYPDLRKRAAETLRTQPFFGYAVGGSLGNSKSQMYEVVEFAAEGLNCEKPIHLLGIGGIEDIFRCVPYGIDTFDCVSPTRAARHGWALVPAQIAADCGVHKREPALNLRNAAFRHDVTPIDPDCTCEACQTVSRSYLHHLLKARETLAQILLTTHNIATMNRVMADVRAGLAAGSLEPARRMWLGG